MTAAGEVTALGPEHRSDVLTVAGIALVAYALANLLHEGLGHGGAAIAVGARPLVLSSLHFESDASGLAPWAGRVISAGGTVVNLLAALLAVVLLRSGRVAWPGARFFLWLFATINLMQGTGYFLFSGIGGIGDWASVVAGWRPAWLWRVGLTVIGGALYGLATARMMEALRSFLPADRGRTLSEAYRLTLTPYLVGAGLYCVSGAFNPAGSALVLVSGVAASLGGTSGLAWGPQFLRGEPEQPVVDPQPIERSWVWIVAGLVVGVAFVAVLGPGVRF